MNFKIEFDQEEDGRRIPEIPELPRVVAYGATQAEAEAAVEALSRSGPLLAKDVRNGARQI